MMPPFTMLLASMTLWYSLKTIIWLFKSLFNKVLTKVR